jgi:uncharacterized membrane protein YraQ (UPF0718 family)
MIILLSITLIITIVSFIYNRKKTLLGIKKGLVLFLRILPILVSVIIIVSVVLSLTPKELFLKYFGNDSGALGYLFAAVIGSIALIPGFIAYPLCGFLIKNGVSYPIIAVFVTTLMMVGIMTIPIEKKYFGIKVTLLRNLMSLIGALIIGTFIGLLW